ncbi:DUF3800 domain-containing protein [Cryobacterium sinapicolor]|uniref:DUF3800 domain-containing protein n=1 Tax=Cryobacterium sinapicolor TaxID=1259236 RepID=A0ABY2IUE4_9MICO|nr:DUF3800 domain-containing protein [Cryobacterium sinapicolor]TFC94042.1 DUF3800 domain-containing protein [Cryobacterium sinapicolor]
MPTFSDYVIYVDESGDHSLDNINPEYPVFVLAFCVFKVSDYVDRIVPAVEQFKFDFFGHDMVILHETEMRKSVPPFHILRDATVREPFFTRLNDIMRDSSFTVVGSAIDKVPFRARRGDGTNPYHVALRYGLERVFMHLQERQQRGRRTHVIFESRGRKEDAELELEFRRIMDDTKMVGMPETLEFLCVSKKSNSSGLQLADMVARPIGLKIFRPAQQNRAWDIIEPKMRKSPQGVINGWGLKVYP